MHRILILCGLFVFCSARITDENVETSFMKPVGWGKRIVCTWNPESLRRQGAGRFTPEDIPVELCTDLIYTHAHVENGVITPIDRLEESYRGNKGLFERFTDLKEENPSLKMILSVGGPKMSSLEFSRIVSSRQSRKVFIDHLSCFLRNRNFDGICIDWVHLGLQGNLMVDKTGFTQLIVELQQAFKEESYTSEKPKLLLTVTVPGNKDMIESFYDVETITPYCDMVLVKSFDMHKTGEQMTVMHSPLRPLPTDTGDLVYRNLDSIVRFLILNGVPENKLIMGLPCFGRTFTLVDINDHSLGAPITGLGMPGRYTRKPGLLSFFEICENINNGWTDVFHPTLKTCFAYGDDQWVTYDDVRSIEEKAVYIRNKGLGGALIANIGMDDFTGEFCNLGTFPLLRKVNEVIGTPIY